MSLKPPVMVLGAGGHAKVVVATLQAQGRRIGGLLDDDPQRLGQKILGVEVLGTIPPRGEVGVEYIPGVGRNSVRKLWAKNKYFKWTTVVHPSALIHESVQLLQGTVVFAGVVIQPDVEVGEMSIVNTAGSIDHDCVVGAYCHIAPGVHLAGGVQLEEGVMMGIASAAIPMVRIGAWACVGAGGVCVCDIEAGKTVTGVPAKERRK